ncbi:hypothetical protein QE152_g5454 [Popillia japonica]|uniref:Uncharacterized protein n=1 Tax=Popillia japonica TaxID=7064 RepID=A0AAW1MIQ5_POPJA
MNVQLNKTTKQDRQTDVDEQAMKKEDFDRKPEEALVFGRRSSIARTPPPSSSIASPITQRAETQEEPEEVFRTPQDIRSLPLTESSRRTLRSTDKGTPTEGDAGSRNPSDGEEIVWLDEEMATSPIYRLYENQGDDSQI